jgi:hypothetical protein
MNENNCPSCRDHEHRLGRLEKEMDEVQTHIKKQSVIVAVISFLGVLITAILQFGAVIYSSMH